MGAERTQQREPTFTRRVIDMTKWLADHHTATGHLSVNPPEPEQPHAPAYPEWLEMVTLLALSIAAGIIVWYLGTLIFK